MSFLKRALICIFLLFTILSLSSCTDISRQTDTVPVSKRIIRLSPLSLTIPSTWQLPYKATSLKNNRTRQHANTDKHEIVLKSLDKTAKATISSKDIVSPPHSAGSQDLIRAYGRIGIKKIIEKDGIQKEFTDNLTIDGQASVQYIIEQGAKVEKISFVKYQDKLFVIRVTAPREKLRAINEEILNNIHFGDESADIVTITQPIDYKISPHIAGLHFGDLQSQQQNLNENNIRGKSISEQIKKLEQICFVNALLRSEGLHKTQDHIHLQIIMNSVRELYKKNKTMIPVARCYGLVLFLENKFSQSFVLFNGIIQNNPDDVYSKLYLVMIKPYSFGDTHIMLEKVFTDDPDNVLALYLQSKMLLLQGKKREGVDGLKKLLRRHPDNVWLNYSLLRNVNEDDSIKPKKIITKYNKILEEVPSFAAARFNLALFLFKIKQYDNALAHLNTILSRYPDDAPTYILKGIIFKTQNKYLPAKKQFEFALSVDPGNFKALYNLGALCAAKLHDTLCARQAFTQYLHIAPQNDRNASVVGWLHEN